MGGIIHILALDVGFRELMWIHNNVFKKVVIRLLPLWWIPLNPLTYVLSRWFRKSGYGSISCSSNWPPRREPCQCERCPSKKSRWLWLPLSKILPAAHWIRLKRARISYFKESWKARMGEWTFPVFILQPKWIPEEISIRWKRRYRVIPSRKREPLIKILISKGEREEYAKESSLLHKIKKHFTDWFGS